MRFFLSLIILSAIASCSDNRNHARINDDILYFEKSVSPDEAMKVLKWMQSINHNWGQPKQEFSLAKKEKYYLFQYPVQIEGAEKEPGNISYMQTFADKLSTDALDGQPVVVRLTDEDWKEEKLLIRSATKN